MAKVFLDPNDKFTVSNSNTSVYGTSGEEVVEVAQGISGLVLDQNVERAQFTGSSSTYKYLQAGNQLKVYATDGTTLLATIPLQGDADGTRLTFTNGTVDVKLQAGGVMSFGGATVSATTAGGVTPVVIDTTLTSPDNSPKFSVAAGAASANEGSSATFTVTLSAAQTTAATVNYALSGTGGAVVGTDTGAVTVTGSGVTVSGTTITFAPGSTVATITVPVTLDAISETGEGLSLALSNPSAGTSLLGTATASVALADLPAPSFTMTSNASGSPTQEGNTITFTVTPSSTVNQDTTLTVNLQGSAVGAITTLASPADFSPNSTTVTFKAGDTGPKTATVTVVSDGVSEGIEGYKASLLDSSFNEKSSISGTINDPVPSLSLTQSAGSIDEGSSVTYTVASTIAAPTGGITVPYTLSGTATAGADYAGSTGTGTITIAAGATTGTLTLNAKADNLTDGAETVIVTLGAPSNGTVATGTQTTTINDTSKSLGSAELSLTGDATVDEGSSATYVLTVGAMPTADLVVPYTLTGSASAGADYTGSNATGSLTIKAGSTAGSVVLAVGADSATEGTETIVMTLGTLPTGYTAVTGKNAVTTSVNDTSVTVPGQTFTLTASSTSGKFDSFTGTSGNDVFNGLIFNSVETGDILTDSSTTDSDTLSARFNLTEANTVSPQVTNVEGISLSVVDGSTSAHILTFDGSLVTGAKTITVDNATMMTGGTADTIKLTSLSKVVGIEISKGDTNQKTEVVFNDVSGSDDSASLKLSSAASGEVKIANIETLNVSGTGTGSATNANAVALLVAANAKTLNISTTGATVISALTGSSALTTIDASVAAGAVTVGASASAILDNVTKVLGGSGGDTFWFTTSRIASTDTIDAGAGTDTLGLAGGLAGSLANVKGFESLRIADTDSYNLAFLTGSSVTSVRADTTGGAVTLSGLADKATVTFTGDTVSGSSSLSAATTGSTLSVDLDNTQGLNADGVDVATLGTSNVTTLNITSQDGKSSLTGANANSALNVNAQTVTVNASARTEISTTSATKSVDASASAARVDINASANTTAATVTGGAGSDSLTGGTGNDVIAGGAGNDTITGGGGNDNLTGAAGNDVFVETFSNITAIDTIAGGDGTDVLQIGDAAANFTTDPTLYTGLTSIEVLRISNNAGTNRTVTVGDSTVSQFGGTLTLQSEGNKSNTLDASTVYTSTNKVIYDSSLATAGLNLKIGLGQDTAAFAATAAYDDTFTVATTGALQSTDNLDAGGKSSGNTLVFTQVDGAATSTFTVTTAQLGAVKNFQTITVDSDGDDIFAFTVTDSIVAANNNGSNVLAFTRDTTTDTGAIKVDASALTANYAVSVTGGAGNESLTGGAGNDTYSGGAGADVLTLSNGGTDRIVEKYVQTDAGDVITGFTTYGTGTSAAAGSDVFVFGAGATGGGGNAEAVALTSSTWGVALATANATAPANTVTALVAGNYVEGAGGSLNFTTGKVNVITSTGYASAQAAFDANSGAASEKGFALFYNIGSQRAELHYIAETGGSDTTLDVDITVAAFTDVTLAGVAGFDATNFAVLAV